MAGCRGLQMKGMHYVLADLLDDAGNAATLAAGSFVTLRLTSAMCHRHALRDCRMGQVRHIFGERWKVNPPALRRVQRLSCRNGRICLGVHQYAVIDDRSRHLVPGVACCSTPAFPDQVLDQMRRHLPRTTPRMRHDQPRSRTRSDG